MDQEFCAPQEAILQAYALVAAASPATEVLLAVICGQLGAAVLTPLGNLLANVRLA